jgi:hypothetical protein
MVNHPGRTRAADLRAVQRLIATSEAWAKVRERNAARVERNGMLGQTDITKERAAQDAYISARDATLARFAPAEL